MKYQMQFSNNQNPISEIKTDIITLSTPNINKASMVLDAVGASSEDIYPWLPWAKQDIALKDIKNHIKHFMDCNAKANPSNLFFDIWDNESDKYLGNIYFGQIEWRAPAFSIGY